jgi:hypothetical protein
MLYLFALAGLAIIVAVFWATAGPRRKPSTPPRALAPDDDPEFLRRLGERRPRPPED